MRRTETERFWAKVDKTGGPEHLSWRGTVCWVWTASRTPGGYGQIRVAGKLVTAHRWAYENAKGPIPAGLQTDHLCRTRACVNPDHLEGVTQQENIRRGLAGKYQSARTHCPQGHPYDAENTHLYQGRRYCLACRKIRNDKRTVREQQRRKALA